MRTTQHKVDFDLGSHSLYLVIADSPEIAAKYIKKKHDIDVTNYDNSEAFFVGNFQNLIIFIHPNTTLDYLVHEIIHAFQYMCERMSTIPDSEAQAYMVQMIFKKMLEKLIKVKKIELKYL